jgi:hypothetical protein
MNYSRLDSDEGMRSGWEVRGASRQRGWVVRPLISSHLINSRIQQKDLGQKNQKLKICLFKIRMSSFHLFSLSFVCDLRRCSASVRPLI